MNEPNHKCALTGAGKCGVLLYTHKHVYNVLKAFVCCYGSYYVPMHTKEYQRQQQQQLQHTRDQQNGQQYTKEENLYVI